MNRHRPTQGPRARARAGSNIALVKYWGKRDSLLNLPATGSLSITLADLVTETTVTAIPGSDGDRLVINGKASDPARVSAFIDLFRGIAGTEQRFVVESSNSFPTAAGLASSASAFAALALALDGLLDLGLSSSRLSELARRGSGSAARSIFGGFVEMQRGQDEDGSDSIARPLAPADHWPLRVVVAVTSTQAKSVSSTQGMNHTVATSAYYPAWVRQVEGDLERARRAIEKRDLAGLCEVAEASALGMHASAMAARPGVIYFSPATLACIDAVRGLRDSGCGVFFTVDAGPQLKAVCQPEDEAIVAETLSRVPGVQRLIRTGLGAGAGRIE
jgi:diphosphomevalonate decarboxylase